MMKGARGAALGVEALSVRSNMLNFKAKLQAGLGDVRLLTRRDIQLGRRVRNAIAVEIEFLAFVAMCAPGIQAPAG